MERREAVVGELLHELRLGVEQLAQPVDPPERRRVEDVQLGTFGRSLRRGAVASVERLAHGRRRAPVPAELVRLRPVRTAAAPRTAVVQASSEKS